MESSDDHSGISEKAFAVMDDDRIATHWVMEHSDKMEFGVAGRPQSGDPVATQNLRPRGH